MKLYIQKNWKFIIGFLILFTAFGWFEVWPAYIKHTCSWIKHHQDAQDAQSAHTINENDPFASIFGNQKPITITEPARPAQPAKDWYEQATPKEYEFCLHNHGI